MDIFGTTVTTEAELRSLYHAPSQLVLTKRVAIDARARAFLDAATFCLLATTDHAGHIDVSPRGGPGGFIKMLDDRHIAVPDLSGNNLLDSLANIVSRPYVGLLALIPGMDETLRVNGAATLTVDDAILSLWDSQLRRPKIAIGITIDEVFVHCAKAFRRGRVWDHADWPDTSAVPDVCETYAEAIGGVTPQQMRDALEQNYAAELGAELAQ